MSAADHSRSLFQRQRRPGDLVFAIAFLVIALFLLLQIGNETKWVKNTKLVAQPAFWPAVSLACMTFFAVLHCVSAAFSKRLPGRAREVGLWLRSLEFAAWFMLYVWVVPVVGYLPSTIIFVFLLIFRLGYRDRKTILLAVFVSVAIVVIFKGFLEVKIPGGQWYELFPDGIRNFMLQYL